MTRNEKDIIIVGGGLTGLCLGLFLGKLGLTITIIEKNQVSKKNVIVDDIRTTAISEGTKDFFCNFNLWNKIKTNCQSIQNIKVYDRGKKNNIYFKNPENDKFLGYIIENNLLKKILLKEIYKNKKILLLENCRLQNIEITNDHACLSTNKKIICGKLLIAADGKNSFVRNILKQKIFSKKYNHSAMVLNINHEIDHAKTAYEIFYKSGPLAILPMKKNKKNIFKSSIIWSHTPSFINSLYSLDKKFIAEVVNEKVEKYIGKVKKINNIQIFPLSAHINSKFYDNRVVYVGDSAHTIHPIAGQGWNLAMRDIDELYKIILESVNLGIDCGSEVLCKKYHNSRYSDAFSLYQITDKLNSIFMFDKIIIKKLRNLGINLVNSNQHINSLISAYAMGRRS